MELLIAIAVIAVVAVLGFPALQRTITASRSVKCMGQMRQVWGRMLIYVNENNGSFPYAHRKETYRFWAQDINAAAGVKDLGIYICPSVNKADLNLALRNLTGGYAYVSYGINFYGISASTATVRKDAPARLMDLPNPGKILGIIDCDDLSQPYDGWYIAYSGRVRSEWDTIAKRHGGRLNVMFCDGHGESMTKEQLYANPTTQEPWVDFKYLRQRAE